MPLFRRRTLFHVEERLPDQEDLKLRFRRRVVACALLGFLVVLGIPVLRQIRPELHARRETRWLAQRLVEARLLAARTRAPVVIRLTGARWERAQLPVGANCHDAAPTAPGEGWDSEGVSWQLKLQRSAGDPVQGMSLCVHPIDGLLLEKEPVADGTLLITAQPVVEGSDQLQPAHLLVSQHGAEIQALNR